MPFVSAVMGGAAGGGGGRSAGQKDQLPDECFRRLRGMLFFGPSFRVTRNKLSFRDNLGERPADETPSTDRAGG